MSLQLSQLRDLRDILLSFLLKHEILLTMSVPQVFQCLQEARV
jgi:hypothetical protein